MNKPQIIAPSLKDIQAASKLIAPYIIRSPLLRLNIDDRDKDIYLKLENLQPIAVFKVRSMDNALLSANEQTLAKGVYTASSGNAGIGQAWPGLDGKQTWTQGQSLYPNIRSAGQTQDHKTIWRRNSGPE